MKISGGGGGGGGLALPTSLKFFIFLSLSFFCKLKLYLFQDGHLTLYQAVSVWKSKHLKMSFLFEKRLKSDELLNFFPYHKFK